MEAHLADIERQPPAYLSTALGPRPESSRGQERWRQGAAAIEGYRERHGITDAQRALGPDPEEHSARDERLRVGRAVEDARAEPSHLARGCERWETARPEPGYVGGPRHGHDRGVPRGLDHGPSLGIGR